MKNTERNVAYIKPVPANVLDALHWPGASIFAGPLQSLYVPIFLTSFPPSLTVQQVIHQDTEIHRVYHRVPLGVVTGW